MSAMPKVPVEDAARACAEALLAQGFTAEECAVLAFVRGASYGVVARRALDDNVPSWPEASK